MHNYFGSYDVIITCKVVSASKHSWVLIMSVYVHIIICINYEHCGHSRDLAENTFLMGVSSGLAD